MSEVQTATVIIVSFIAGLVGGAVLTSMLPKSTEVVYDETGRIARLQTRTW
jgi:hypothetical protein